MVYILFINGVLSSFFGRRSPLKCGWPSFFISLLVFKGGIPLRKELLRARADHNPSCNGWIHSELSAMTKRIWSHAVLLLFNASSIVAIRLSPLVLSSLRRGEQQRRIVRVPQEDGQHVGPRTIAHIWKSQTYWGHLPLGLRGLTNDHQAYTPA